MNLLRSLALCLPLPGKLSFYFLYLAFYSIATSAHGLVHDQLIQTAIDGDGDITPYMLTSNAGEKISYAFIVMPGGLGLLDPELRDGKVWFKMGGNFLIRSRRHFVDDRTVVIATNATNSAKTMRAIIGDIARRYPEASIYIAGTSRSTHSTMRLAQPLDGWVAGFIHASSMSAIAGFDTKGFKSRHLIVHHQSDGCRLTPYGAALANHEDFQTPLITMQGGQDIGDPCEALGHHGYGGIEQETIKQIKAWVRSGS